MLKRLIEVALPLKEVSEHSAREKSIRHGHISTLHIWWARRPLAACRAAVFASLVPDPDDSECPEEFRKFVRDVLGQSQFKPTNGDGSSIEDTPRNRCLEFIKHLVRWENSNNPNYIEPARKLIAAAHKFLHPDAEGDMPKVLDPFAGGGSIPLEALRLGCEAHAIDLNPVAHLIELCTLVYPQKYGQSNSRPVPDYIKQLIAHNQTKRKAEGEASLFDENYPATVSKDEIIPHVEITEAEYRKNPLASDVKYWGHWLVESVRYEIARFYPNGQDGTIPMAYIWARTVACSNPLCRATIPLILQSWLCNNARRKIAFRLIRDESTKRCQVEIAHGSSIDFEPEQGTIQQGKASCPFCNFVVDGETLRSESKAGRMGQQLLAVITTKAKSPGKDYRPASQEDLAAIQCAVETLTEHKAKYGKGIVPDESITPDRPAPNSRGLSAVVRYGIATFGLLFNDRQSLLISSLLRHISSLSPEHFGSNPDYFKAIVTYLSLVIDWFIDKSTMFTRWHNSGEKISGAFSRQALPMVWDYAEVNPFSGVGADFLSGLGWTLRVIDMTSTVSTVGIALRGNALALPTSDRSVDAIVTDPPYYDSVPYSDLSDFFYVWLKRGIKGVHPDLFVTPLTPKQQELIAYYGSGKRRIQKPPDWYEKGMEQALSEMWRAMRTDGIGCLMFAHKTTTAWESAIEGLLRSGLTIIASWPLHTEMKTRTVAQNAAALASSVTLVFRKREAEAGSGLWDDIRQQVKSVVSERLDFFWNQGIRGADFFISAIGPALSVFGKYERVTKLSGEEVTVGQFLDEVRRLVTNYALTKILHTTHTGAIDPESRFYVVWQWSYGDAKVPADESFKLSQALGMHTEEMWDRTGVLEKAGENVQVVPIAKRMRVKSLGEPGADGTPAGLIDVLHRLCAFRERGDTQGMAQFLGQSGHANNPTLWLVAQAISEILPDGDKEKQLMQGLLNQREALEEATRQRALF
jgi:adenine-specific DNA methylase